MNLFALFSVGYSGSINHQQIIDSTPSLESSGEHGCLTSEKSILSHPEKQEGTLGDKAG